MNRMMLKGPIRSSDALSRDFHSAGMQGVDRAMHPLGGLLSHGETRRHGQTISFPIANAMSASRSSSPPVIKSFVNLSFGGRPVTASHA